MKAFSDTDERGVYATAEEEALASNWREERETQLDAARQEEAETHFEKLFTDPHYFAQLAKDPLILEAEKRSLTPSEVRYGAANRAYLSSHTGRELTGSEYTAVRDSYAKQMFGKPKAGEKEFFDLVKGQYETKQKRRAAATELYTGAIKQTLEDALAGTSTSTVEMFGKWRDKNKEVISAEDELGFQLNAFAVVRKAKKDIAKVAPQAARVWQSLMSYNEGEASEQDVQALGMELAAMPRAERKVAFGYALLAAQASGEGAEPIEQAAKNLEKAVQRSFSFLESPLKFTNVGGALPLSIPTLAYVPLGVIEQQARTRMQQLSRDDDLRTSPEKQAELARMQQTIEMTNVVRELKQLARDFDPIKPVFPEGTLSGTIERGVIGAAGSAGYMMAAATSPLLGLYAISGSEYDDMRRENPDMNPHVAAAASLVSGSIQTFIERAQIQTFADIGRALAGIKQGVARTAARAGAGIAKENAQEAIQDAVSAGIPLVMSHLQADMPNQDGAKIMESYVKERPEVFFATLALLPFGVFSGKVADFQGNEMDDRTLVYLGFNDKQRAVILASPSPGAALSAEIPKRAQGNIKKGVKQMEADLANVEAAQANASLPTLESAVLPDGTREWTITRNAPEASEQQVQYLSEKELKGKEVTISTTDPATGQVQQVTISAEAGQALAKRNIDAYTTLVDCLLR